MSARATASCKPNHYDAIIVGAGIGGIRALHEMRQLGLAARLFEAGSDIGGTWYWNRYPGCRTDSEAWVYCYSFSKEILNEWSWQDKMPSWSQILDYLRFVVNKLDLAPCMQFNSRIESARFDSESDLWRVRAGSGESYTCRYLISAVGILSAVYEPPFPGLDRFRGEYYLSARWPREKVEFAGKRVGIVGSGSTGVQLLPIIAQTAAHVSLIQRTPNFVIPARNSPLEAAHNEAVKANYDAVWALARRQVFGMAIASPGRCYDDVDDEERQRIFDAGWEAGGFRFIFETFDDLLVDERSNEAAAEFVRNKIRSIVRDRKTAELLCPYYEIGIKRPPLGSFYYETFNRENVSLIDVRNDPIKEITARGIRTHKAEYEFDVIIFALGFDAGTGALTRMDVRGIDGLTIAEKWANGPRTNLGITIDGFPNLFIISGPQSPFANIPPVLEAAVSWIGKAIVHAQSCGASRMDTSAAAVEAWRKKCAASIEATLLRKGGAVNAWFVGANIPGKAHSPLFYFGGAPGYFIELDQSAANGFRDFVFSRSRPGGATPAL